MHTVLFADPLGQADACTCQHDDATGCLLHLRHPHTLALFALTPGCLGEPSGSLNTFKELRAKKDYKKRKHCVELTYPISPLHKAIPLVLIGMSPSWLLPEISEYRPHALVFSGYLKLIWVFLRYFPFWNVHLWRREMRTQIWLSPSTSIKLPCSPRPEKPSFLLLPLWKAISSVIASFF